MRSLVRFLVCVPPYIFALGEENGVLVISFCNLKFENFS
ncbi:uncharacterized protein J3R85_013641 [Psidium guajava]|nr:uncharacterized protein J3R85_013641 [Psidium guajava]